MNRCRSHKYDRVVNKKKDTIIYKCLNCPHWCAESQVIGRSALCRYCDKEFLMNKEVLLKKPHCGCRFKKAGKLLKEIAVDEGRLDDLIGGLLK